MSKRSTSESTTGRRQGARGSPQNNGRGRRYGGDQEQLGAPPPHPRRAGSGRARR